MNMWDAYISATREWIPDADKKIAFDEACVAKYLGDAVGKLRRAANKELLARGDRSMVGTKYSWMRKLSNIPGKFAATFDESRPVPMSARHALDSLDAPLRVPGD